MRHNRQAQSKAWWEAHPMGYDWRETLQVDEGTPEFFQEIDSRFFASSPFYAGTRPFESLIPFDDLERKRVLEIGCGLGAHAQLLAAAGCRLTCIDVTQRAVMLTRRRLALRGLSVEVEVMDAEEMKFPDAIFDLIWSWGVIHHSSNTEKIVDQAYRVLKPGGEFRMMVYHRASLLARAFLLRGLLTGKYFRGMSAADVLDHYSDGHTARHFTRRELAEMLEWAGFDNVEVSVLGQKSELLPLPGWGPFGRLKSSLLARLPDGLARRALAVVGNFLFAVARKGSSSPTAGI